ncbi:MAG: hypothetical protein AAF620_15295 [Bacteroidota bacterium]
MKGNKLPRKRKKKFIKEIGRTNYVAFQIINELDFEQHGISDWRFPKFKKGQKSPVGFY